jgi:hypothetical protein
MSNILDLGALTGNATFDIKLFDGSILHIKKPTQKIYMFFMQLEKLGSLSSEETVSTLNQCTLMIINHNLEGKTFDIDYVIDNFDLGTITAIINAYTDFIKEISDNHFTSRQPSPQAKKAAPKKRK